MGAGLYTFNIRKGATFSKTITWLDDNSTPVDVSGYGGLLRARMRPGDATILLELSSADGHITFGTSNGTILLAMDEIETAALSWNGRAYFQLDLYPPVGGPIAFLEGRIELTEQIT